MTGAKMWKTNYMDDYNKKTKRKSYRYGRKLAPKSTAEVPVPSNPYASSADIYQNALLDSYAAECEQKWPTNNRPVSAARPGSSRPPSSRPSTSMGFHRTCTPQPPAQVKLIY